MERRTSAQEGPWGGGSRSRLPLVSFFLSFLLVFFSRSTERNSLSLLLSSTPLSLHTTVPAVVLTLGGLLLPDTPNSLAARGKRQEALAVLRRVRGVEDVDAEFSDICAAADAADGASAASGGSGWAMILRRKYRPELTMAVLIPLFQQLTGERVFFFKSFFLPSTSTIFSFFVFLVFRKNPT